MNRALGEAIALVPVLFLLSRSPATGQNLVTNPSFDTSVAGWGPATAPPLWDGTRDAEGNPGSGSAQTQNSGGVLIPCFPVLTQCVGGVAPGQAYEFGGQLFIPPGQLGPGNVPVLGGAQVAVGWSTLAACGSDAQHPLLVLAGPSSSSTGAWISSSGTTTAPPGAVSVLVQGVSCHTLGNGTLQVNFDDMFFRAASPAVVPTLDRRGLAAFALLLAATSFVLRRRSAPGAEGSGHLD